MPSEIPLPSVPPAPYPDAPQALQDLRPVLLALPVMPVPPFRSPVTEAVIATFRIAQSYAEDRPLFIATFTPEAFNPLEFDNLIVRGLALWQADTDCHLATISTKSLARVLVEAKPLREHLLKSASYLWGEHPDLGAVVANIRTPRGTLAIADGLTSLATLFQEHWQQAEGRCDVTSEQIPQANFLARSIVECYKPKAATKSNVKALIDLRDRAGYYLADGVQTVRCAADFIFRNRPESLTRYPTIHVRNHKRAKRAEKSGLSHSTRRGRDVEVAGCGI